MVVDAENRKLVEVGGGSRGQAAYLVTCERPAVRVVGWGVTASLGRYFVAGRT